MIPTASPFVVTGSPIEETRRSGMVVDWGVVCVYSRCVAYQQGNLNIVSNTYYHTVIGIKRTLSD